MTRTARLTKAELRRAIAVAEERGKRLRVTREGDLVFEERCADDGLRAQTNMQVEPVREAVF